MKQTGKRLSRGKLYQTCDGMRPSRKRSRLAILLAMVLLTTLFTGTVSCENALDRAFNSAFVIFEENIDYAYISSENLEIPEDLAELLESEYGSDAYANLLQMLNSGCLATPLSYSPSGNSGIYMIDEVGFVRYNDQFRALYPSRSQGVEDVYSNLDFYSKIIMGKIHGMLPREGVIYSADGHYAVLIDPYSYVALNRKYRLDPILIDLTTGEMILTATYPNKPSEGGAEAITSGCFSADGQYFYYIVSASFTDIRMKLYRYNLQDQTTELCLEGTDAVYSAGLSEIADGSLIALLQKTADREFVYDLVNFVQEDGRWVMKVYDRPVGSKCFDGNTMYYSPVSGNALITNPRGEGTYTMQVFRPNDGFTGLDQYICLPKDEYFPRVLSADELAASFGGRTAYEVNTSRDPEFRFQEIVNAVLSPDGRYVLLNLRYPLSNYETKNRLLIMRLEDHVSKEIIGLDAEEIMIGALGDGYRITIEWNTDRLIVGTRWGIKTYQIQ